MTTVLVLILCGALLITLVALVIERVHDIEHDIDEIRQQYRELHDEGQR